MGRTFLIVILCIAPLSIWSQEKPATQEEADKLDSLVSILMRNQHYEDALQTKMREIEKNVLISLSDDFDILSLKTDFMVFSHDLPTNVNGSTNCSHMQVIKLSDSARVSSVMQSLTAEIISSYESTVESSSTLCA